MIPVPQEILDISANNVMVIKEAKPGFKVFMADMDTRCRIGKIYKFKTLRQAILKAQNMVNYHWVEYGIRTELRDDG